MNAIARGKPPPVKRRNGGNDHVIHVVIRRVDERVNDRPVAQQIGGLAIVGAQQHVDGESQSVERHQQRRCQHDVADPRRQVYEDGAHRGAYTYSFHCILRGRACV